jgi:hypothetical protein
MIFSVLLVSLIAINAVGIASSSTLFRSIVQERDIFIRFGSHFNGDDILCEIVRLGEDRVGLLLLEPSGVLKTVIVSRVSQSHDGVLQMAHATTLNKAMRQEYARNGMHMANVRFVAEQIAGLYPLQEAGGGSLPPTTPKTPRPRRKEPPPQEAVVEAPSHTAEAEATKVNKVNKDADVWEIARERVAQNKEIASMRTEDILARFKKDVEKSQGLAVTEQ